jgi:hypothetical protein
MAGYWGLWKGAVADASGPEHRGVLSEADVAHRQEEWHIELIKGSKSEE